MYVWLCRESWMLALPVEGTVDSMILRPRVLASKSAFTRFTFEVVIASRSPLMTMALNNLQHKSRRLVNSMALLLKFQLDQVLLGYAWNFKFQNTIKRAPDASLPVV